MVELRAHTATGMMAVCAWWTLWRPHPGAQPWRRPSYVLDRAVRSFFNESSLQFKRIARGDDQNRRLHSDYALLSCNIHLSGHMAYTTLSSVYLGIFNPLPIHSSCCIKTLHLSLRVPRHRRYKGGYLGQLFETLDQQE